jgi:hypothetical protein
MLNAFLRYKSMKKVLEKLSSRQGAALAKKNQQVFIRDLVVRTVPPHCYGESEAHTNPYTNIPENERLIGHIQALFSLANEDHRTEYCLKGDDGKFKLKEDRKNCITRLTMNEFSLYTRSPLSADDFNKVLSGITEMAYNLEPNVHVLLSSFSVKVENGKVLNMSIFVEGGNPPALHTFAKNMASTVDVSYQDAEKLFSQQDRRLWPTYHADIAASETGLSVGMGSVFVVTTAGGATYTQAVDVCLDHALGHSKEIMARRILEDASPDEIIPEQIEQCVTSNWIDIVADSSIATTVLHADPVRSMHEFHKAPLGKLCVSQDTLKQIKPEEFTQMQISETKTGYKIEKPPFGSDCIVDVLSERPAAKHLPLLQASIKKHNDSALDRAQMNAWAQSEEERIIHVASKSDFILHRIEELERNMLNKCRPSFWQKIFRTEEYRQKIGAKSIIKRSFELMKPNFQKKSGEEIFLIEPFKKDLVFRLHHFIQFDAHNPFIKSLTDEVTEIINKKLQNDLKCQFSKETAGVSGANSLKISA